MNTKRQSYGSTKNLTKIMDAANGKLSSGGEKDSTAVDGGPQDETRGKWGNQLDFLMSCIGYAVGLGNIWRFPYLCFKNGGGAFLVPYLIFVLLAGIPLFFLEVSLGQFLSLGGVDAFNICPLLKGVGYASMVMASYCCVYYVVIVAWTITYLYWSMRADLPWDTCDSPWNNNSICLPFGQNATVHRANFSLDPDTPLESPAEQFWDNQVLSRSSGIDVIGDVQWDLAIALLIGWVLVYLIIWRGIHNSGKVLWFTAMFPYVILISLFIFIIIQDGASNGIIYFLTPNITKLAEPTVWIDAGTQVFFSYGIGYGSLLGLGSFSAYHHNCLKDSLIVGVINSGTSLFGGFVIFSVLGFMAKAMDVEVKDVVTSGPGLAFIAYPAAVAQMPISPLWACLFFLMLLILGLDTQFCTVQGVITGLADDIAIFGRNRKMFTLGVCVTLYLVGLLLITNGGVFVFELFNYYSASGMTLLFIVFMQTVTISWVYGAENVFLALNDMLGFNPGRFWMYIWKFAAPAIMLAVFIFYFVQLDTMKYGNWYTYPWWGTMIGWLLATTSMVVVPGYAIYHLIFKEEGSLNQRWRNSLKPTVGRVDHLKVTGTDSVQMPVILIKNEKFAYDNQAVSDVPASVTDKDGQKSAAAAGGATHGGYSNSVYPNLADHTGDDTVDI